MLVFPIKTAAVIVDLHLSFHSATLSYYKLEWNSSLIKVPQNVYNLSLEMVSVYLVCVVNKLIG